jgi:hypothetical protein
MARRLFMHVGTPKSGTTYLQDTLWSHKSGLSSEGILVPLKGPLWHWAAAIEMGDRELDLGTRTGALQQLIAAINKWEGDVIVSSEFFLHATREKVAEFFSQLNCDEIHVIITARKLLLQVPSAWQQGVKNGNPVSYEEFLASAMEDREKKPFWRSHNTERIARRWSPNLPPRNVHIVVAPGRGAAPDELWRRFCSVTNIDSQKFPGLSVSRNPTLGVASTELIRKILSKSTMGSSSNSQLRRDGVVRNLAMGSLVQFPDEPIGCPIDFQPWFVEQSQLIMAAIERNGYHIVGDLSEMRSSILDVPDHNQPEDWRVLHAALVGALGLMRERDAFRIAMVTESQAGRRELREREIKLETALDENRRLRSVRGGTKTVLNGLKRRFRRLLLKS